MEYNQDLPLSTAELASVVSKIDHTPLEVSTPSFTVQCFMEPDLIIQYTSVPDVDPELDRAVREQAGKMYYVGAQSARAAQQYANIKHFVDILEANLNHKYREELSAEGKVTEKQIDAKVLRDAGYTKAILQMNKAKAHADQMQSAVESMRQQRDMLQLRGNDRRAEHKGEMRIMGSMNAAQEVEQSRAQTLALLAQQRKVA